MMDDILVKVDRASMYNSLEVRAPFLDTDIVELLVNLPLSFKLHGFTSKYLLKKLMEDKLPHDIVYRKKKGLVFHLRSGFRVSLNRLYSTCLVKRDSRSKDCLILCILKGFSMTIFPRRQTTGSLYGLFWFSRCGMFDGILLRGNGKYQ